jgi:effector-binding domain-containing protein
MLSVCISLQHFIMIQIVIQFAIKKPGLYFLSVAMISIGLSLRACMFVLMFNLKNHIMEIKELQPVFVYYRQVITTLNEIGKYVGDTPAKLAGEAEAEGFKITGPQIWNYSGVDGKPDTKFTVDICFPVERKEGVQSKNTKTIDGYKCASARVNGPWSDLHSAYNKLIAEMAAKLLQPSGTCREVYHVCDFENPSKCVTEIQLGINN